MKKCILLISSILIIMIITFVIPTYATQPPTTVGNGYEFSLNYTGDITEEEDKDATVVLAGTDATPYSNVRIKVDVISGPGVPSVVAYDSQGIGYNIIEFGYWGPEAGFAVGGTFSNETPVVARFPEAGTYVIQLALIDVNNNSQVITSKQFTMDVKESEPIVDNTIVNNTVTNEINNIVEEIPQAGINIWTYLLIITVVIAGLILGRKYLIRK